MHPDMLMSEITPTIPPINITGRQKSTAKTESVASNIFGDMYFMRNVHTKRIPTNTNSVIV